jgi:putative transcriptional regulator
VIICKLGELMEKRSLTNKNVVDLTGVSRNTVKGFQTNASKRIDYETLDNLCKGLNCKVEDILEFIPDKENEAQ